jgi:hypothetical protein
VWVNQRLDMCHRSLPSAGISSACQSATFIGKWPQILYIPCPHKSAPSERLFTEPAFPNLNLAVANQR